MAQRAEVAVTLCHQIHITIYNKGLFQTYLCYKEAIESTISIVFICQTNTYYLFISDVSMYQLYHVMKKRYVLVRFMSIFEIDICISILTVIQSVSFSFATSKNLKTFSTAFLSFPRFENFGIRGGPGSGLAKLQQKIICFGNIPPINYPKIKTFQFHCTRKIIFNSISQLRSFQESQNKRRPRFRSRVTPYKQKAAMPPW